MSVAPISGQMSASFAVGAGAATASTAATTAPTAPTATGETAATGGATSLQQSLLMQNGGANGIDQLAALMMSLLLGKSKEAKNDDDPWKTLMALAMLSGAGGKTTVSMSQTITAPGEAYAAAGAGAAAAPSVNVQG